MLLVASLLIRGAPAAAAAVFAALSAHQKPTSFGRL